MAQTSTLTKNVLSATNLAVSVAVSGDTTLLDLDVLKIDEIGISVAVSTNNLDAFKVYGKMHSDSAYVLLYSTSGDYTSPAGILMKASGNLTAQAAATTGWLFIDTKPLYGLKITASAVTGAASVDVYAIGKG